MSLTFPHESSEYRDARNQLLDKEFALRRAMEEVAEARRALPPGGPLAEDYVLSGPGGADVRFSELFGTHRSLLVYSYMFPRDPDDDRPGPETGSTADLALGRGPCPSCTALLDQLDGAVEHVTAHAAFVVVAKAPIEHLLAFADERGWRRLRLLSCGETSYAGDYHGETDDGAPRPMMNVFHRDGDLVRHTWGSELLYAPTEPDQDPRHLGALEPVWNMFDLTPEGRGVDWDEQICYH